MKKYLLPAAAMLLSASASTIQAVTADPRPRPVHMPDGTTVTVRLLGDENFHMYVTEAGFPLLRGADGFLYYAEKDAFGIPGASAVRPGSTDAKLFEKTHDASLLRDAVYAKSSTSRAPKKGTSAPKKATYPTKGEGRGIVVLVEYEDLSFSVPNARDEFDRMLNEPGYSDFGGTGSAADWFADNSMRQFTPHFDVYGPVTLAHPMAYYGTNGGNGDDVNAHLMPIEACMALDDEVDFSIYDQDGDGFIDNVFVFYAGYGENLGGDAPAEAVWPHSWDIADISSTPYVFDGVRLNHYACTNEIDLDNVMDGIGTFCHEFSHVLGLPDLYATNYSYAFTPGEWSVMDAGSYNNNSRTPPFYSAFERMSLGWMTPREIGAPANIKLDHVSENAGCIIRTNNDNEYFILENRQQRLWDKYIPYHGMLIWHIDYNENIWYYNTVNDRQSHQYVDIEEADGMQSSANVEGDCFPGMANVTSFTDDTTPGMLTWDGVRQEKPVTDIRESNGYIYFKVSGGRDEVTAVEALEAGDVTPESFTASWTRGDDGSEYILSVYTLSESASGKVKMDYVQGYESRNVGDTLRWKVEGLRPSTLYHYSVRAYDRDNDRQSVASNDIEVMTLDPTFDCLVPVITSVEIADDASAVISWEGVEEADDYIIDVYSKVYGEEETETVDFTGGISAMPAGWQTPSTFTYGNAAYAGESAPALRLNSAASWLQSAEYPGGVRSISFWLRGVGVSASDRICVSTQVADEWLAMESFEIPTSAEGSTFVLDGLPENPAWPGYISSFRISIEAEGKGAVALDDVKVGHSGDVEKIHHENGKSVHVGNVTAHRIKGLVAGKTYWATVTAVSDEILSRPSLEKRLCSSAIGSVDNTSAENAKVSVNGREVTVAAVGQRTLTLSSVSGAVVASAKVTESTVSLLAPAAGCYILSDGRRSWKIMVK